ncbi:carboxypeptidase regulatory-like domain-containing protein, partial [bacterium]|nr:carboxypeptidase regulatory-like domain-containing protein [bacterium]
MARISNILMFAFALLGVILVGCESDDSSGPTTGEGQLSGFVYDQSTNGPLSGAIIVATSVSEGNKVDSSKGDGSFAINFTVDSTTTISVRVSKTGYTDQTYTLTLRSGSVTTLNVVLVPKS